MQRYYLVGLTSSEGIDKNFNPKSVRTFYNTVKGVRMKVCEIGAQNEIGHSCHVTLYINEFAQCGYKYMRNGKKFSFHAFVLDLMTQQVCCMDMQTLIEKCVNGLIICNIDYQPNILELKVADIQEKNSYFAPIIAKTSEFDTLFTIKANLMEKSFFIVNLEAINGVTDFSFDVEKYYYEEALKRYTVLFNSSFTLGFYTEDGVLQETITTTYFQALFLYIYLRGIDDVFRIDANHTQVRHLCYINKAFNFLSNKNRIYLARQSKVAIPIMEINPFFVKKLKPAHIENLDITPLVRLKG